MTIRERLRRLIAGAPAQAECPIPDCSTCPPEPPLDVVAEEQRAHDACHLNCLNCPTKEACDERRARARARAWLRVNLPEIWNDRDPDDQFLALLVDLNRQVENGRWM